MSTREVHPTEPAEGDPSVPPPEESGATTSSSFGPSGGEDHPLAAPDSGPLATETPVQESGQASPVDWGLGVVRTGVGVALMVAPGWAGRIWVGPGADGPGSKVFARALGARDVALGVQILRGLSRGEVVRHWILAGFVADAADVTASVIASRNMTPARRVLVPLVASAVGALGVSSWKAGSPQAP